MVRQTPVRFLARQRLSAPGPKGSPNATTNTARVDAGAAARRAAVASNALHRNRRRPRESPHHKRSQPHWACPTRRHTAKPCPPPRTKRTPTTTSPNPTVTTSRSAASTIILNRLDDFALLHTGCDYDHTARIGEGRSPSSRTRPLAIRCHRSGKAGEKAVVTEGPAVSAQRGVTESFNTKGAGYCLGAGAGRARRLASAPCFTGNWAPSNVSKKHRHQDEGHVELAPERAFPTGQAHVPGQEVVPLLSVPEKGTRAFYEWKARQKTRLKMREEKFFGGKRRFWGAAGQRPPTTMTPVGGVVR